MKKIGDRVGAIHKANDNVVELFGYGIYKGDEIPPPEIKLLGMSLAELGISNPRIDLDNGKTVWGCECWWGNEEQVMKSIAGRELILVDIEKIRKESNETEEQS